jgi:hypothetical protein
MTFDITKASVAVFILGIVWGVALLFTPFSLVYALVSFVVGSVAFVVGFSTTENDDLPDECEACGVELLEGEAVVVCAECGDDEREGET